MNTLLLYSITIPLSQAGYRPTDRPRCL